MHSGNGSRIGLVAAIVVILALAPGPAARAQEPPEKPPAAPPKPGLEETAKSAAAARDRGLVWLAAHQNENGSWGGGYCVAVTSFACLAYLAAADEPYDGPHAEPLLRGISFLLSQQKDGLFPQQGHIWIHGQGFATLALSEAYGRALLAEAKPDLDLLAIRATISRAVRIIVESQSTSGGWWYTPGSPGRHEGSTTVTAVQALVSARNFGLEIDEAALVKGFEYLKKCQNKDGGFDYMLGPGETSMKEGTAADVATLALMQRFDYRVMMNGYQFLMKIGPAAITGERFPYYGHFYGCMGMLLLKEEFPSFAEKIDAYVCGAYRDIVGWQAEDGSWPIKSCMTGKESAAYSTAFAALLLSVTESRLSIFNRDPPELPKPPAK